MVFCLGFVDGRFPKSLDKLQPQSRVSPAKISLINRRIISPLKDDAWETTFLGAILVFLLSQWLIFKLLGLHIWQEKSSIDFYVMVLWLTEFLGRCNLIFQECCTSKNWARSADKLLTIKKVGKATVIPGVCSIKKEAQFFRGYVKKLLDFFCVGDVFMD